MHESEYYYTVIFKVIRAEGAENFYIFFFKMHFWLGFLYRSVDERQQFFKGGEGLNFF